MAETQYLQKEQYKFIQTERTKAWSRFNIFIGTAMSVRGVIFFFLLPLLNTVILVKPQFVDAGN